MSPFVLSGHNIDPEITPVYAVRGGIDLLRFRDFGTPMLSPLTGGPATLLNFPQRDAGNMLMVVSAGTSNTVGPAEGATWVSRGNTGSNIHQMWTRQATNDANDNFTVPAHAFMQISQMYSFTTPFALTVFSISLSLPGVAENEIPTPGMPADAGGPDTIIVGINWKRINPSVDAPVVTDVTNPMKLGTFNSFRDAVSGQTLITTIGWKYQAVNAALAADEWINTPQRNALVRGKLWRFKTV